MLLQKSFVVNQLDLLADVTQGGELGIDKIDNGEGKDLQVFLTPAIQPQAFAYFLEFLYTGKWCYSSLSF